MSEATFRVVIPARLGSSRLPNKPLLQIAGRPLVAHVWENARRSRASQVVVAADDQRIVDVIEDLGGEAILTSADHPTGTDRLAEVARRLRWSDDEIVVNLQGDEPMVPPGLVERLAEALADNPRAGIATIGTPIRTVQAVVSASVVKIVVDGDGFALYFSRAPIPWPRDAFSEGPPAVLPESPTFIRHIGLYAYRVATLRRVSSAEVAPPEAAESLEQLRAMWLGIPIHVTLVDEAPPHGVDTPEDLERVRGALEGA